MKAYQLVEWQQAPELRDVEVPVPGPGEVLVKVGGAGACHSDLHVMEWAPGFLPYELPFTLGHENAGWVEAAFAGALHLRLGGSNSYGGVLRKGPILGDGRPPEAADIRRAIRLMRRVCVLLAGLALTLTFARGAAGG